MFEPQDHTDLAEPAELAVDEKLLAELEAQSIDAIRKVRAHERVRAQVTVELRPGDSSRRDELHLVGRTADISEGGCSAVFPGPVLAGDVFCLEFDGLDLPMVFARALRCRMLREGSFEVGFRFFTPVRLEASRSDDLLG